MCLVELKELWTVSSTLPSTVILLLTRSESNASGVSKQANCIPFTIHQQHISWVNLVLELHSKGYTLSRLRHARFICLTQYKRFSILSGFQAACFSSVHLMPNKKTNGNSLMFHWGFSPTSFHYSALPYQAIHGGSIWSDDIMSPGIWGYRQNN